MWGCVHFFSPRQWGFHLKKSINNGWFLFFLPFKTNLQLLRWSKRMLQHCFSVKCSNANYCKLMSQTFTVFSINTKDAEKQYTVEISFILNTDSKYDFIGIVYWNRFIGLTKRYFIKVLCIQKPWEHTLWGLVWASYNITTHWDINLNVFSVIVLRWKK